jgi:hypothetical protein
MEKECSECKKIKSLVEFNLKNRLKKKYQSLCKDCNKEKSKKYYRENKEHHLSVIYKNKRKYKTARKEFLQEVKKLNGCALCDEKEVCCMDFHHLHNKKFLISTNVIISIEAIKEELKKCVCLCSNCHRKVHNNILKVDEQDLCKLPE